MPIPPEKPLIEQNLTQEAYYDQGVKYQTGEGVDKNLYKAGAYFGEAAALGSEAALQHLAQNSAACRTEMETGIDNPESCILSAASGDLDIQLALAARYEGSGDKEEAKKWWREAAKQGHVFAQYAMFRAEGSGVGMPYAQEVLDDPEPFYLMLAYSWLCVLEKQANAPGSPGLDMWQESGFGDDLWSFKAELDKEARKFLTGWPMKKMCNHYIATYYQKPE